MAAPCSRATLFQIASSEISAQLSADGTVSFFDPPVMFNRADVDRVLAQAQQQAVLLAGLEREMGRSKEYLTKVRIIVVSCRLWRVWVLPHNIFYTVPRSSFSRLR